MINEPKTSLIENKGKTNKLVLPKIEVWANIRNSIILYDRDNKVSKLQDKCKVSYPEELKENILKK